MINESAKVIEENTVLGKRERPNNLKNTEDLEKEVKKLKSENHCLRKEIEEGKCSFEKVIRESHQAYQEQQLEEKKKDSTIKEIKQSLISTKKSTRKRAYS